MRERIFIKLLFLINICCFISCNPTHYSHLPEDCQYSIASCSPKDDIPCFPFLFMSTDIVIAQATIDLQESKIQGDSNVVITEKFTIIEVLQGNTCIQDTFLLNYYDWKSRNERFYSIQKDSIYVIFQNIKHNKKDVQVKKYKLLNPSYLVIPIKAMFINEKLVLHLSKLIRNTKDGMISVYYPNTQDLFFKGRVKNQKLQGKFFIYCTQEQEDCLGLEPKTFPFYEGYIDKKGNSIIKYYSIVKNKKGKNIKKLVNTYQFVYD